MDSDTDTDSEPGVTSTQWNAADFSSFSTQRAHICTGSDVMEESVQEKAHEAIQTLDTLDIDSVVHKSSHLEQIAGASGALLRLLEAILTSSTDEMNPGLIELFAQMTHEAFLCRLFEYRRAFQFIASRDISPGTAPSAIVCWVDLILTKLGEATVVIAGGSGDRSDDTLAVASLAKQKENDSLLAATQLPNDWRAVPGLLASDRASPAVLRLALRLTFAAYILLPQLKGEDPDIVVSKLPSLPKILQTYSAGFSDNVHGHREHRAGPLELNLKQNERTVYAMIVVLFTVVTQKSKMGSNPDESSPVLHPYTQSLAVHLIQFIMHPDTTSKDFSPLHPCETLDSAQTILLRWGGTVPRCWAIWSDARCIGIEDISHLTATWLFQLNSFSDDPEPQTWATDLLRALAENSHAAEIAMMQLLHHAVYKLTSLDHARVSAASLDVLRKTCWAAAQLLNTANPWHLVAGPALVRSLCIIFAFSGDGNDEGRIKDSIIEALTRVDSQTMQSTIKGLLEDGHIAFSLTFDTTLVGLRRAMQRVTELSPLSDAKCNSISLALRFLAIIWRHGAPSPSHRNTRTGFVAAVVNSVSEQPLSNRRSLLLCDLLVALSTVHLKDEVSTPERVSKVWDEETIWSLSMERGPRTVLVASCLASYILAAKEALTPSALACAEAWDYMRDVLLLTLSRHFLADDEPLALLAAPTLCRALVALLRGSDGRFVPWAVASPWTESLSTELRSLFDSRDEVLSTSSAILKERLRSAGEILLHEIKNRVEGIETTVGAPTAYSNCIMYYRSEGFSHLVLIPSEAAA
ncbi:hypothetical protein BV25DRAFT_1987190 [Artomyces pyxidatus]|uniref:Uncharacterized protein n=1 Tax=Artomyces pyxidatus TaxID=48021 RepID=A0ACB8TIY4_9AGAM|nr:hypothetical protein BV25DRAFT_1987190 [Artomyces pyxidatus]